MLHKRLATRSCRKMVRSSLAKVRSTFPMLRSLYPNPGPSLGIQDDADCCTAERFSRTRARVSRALRCPSMHSFKAYSGVPLQSRLEASESSRADMQLSSAHVGPWKSRIALLLQSQPLIGIIQDMPATTLLFFPCNSPPVSSPKKSKRISL